MPETERQLTHSRRSGREIGKAIGVLMERYKTNRGTAFTVVRDHARSQRRKLNDVAQEVLASAEALNVFVDRFAEPGRVKR